MLRSGKGLQPLVQLGHAAWPVRKNTGTSLRLSLSCSVAAPTSEKKKREKVPRDDQTCSPARLKPLIPLANAPMPGVRSPFFSLFFSFFFPPLPVVQQHSPRSAECSSYSATVTRAERSAGGTAHSASRGQSQRSVRTWKQEAKAFMGTWRGGGVDGGWIEGGGGAAVIGLTPHLHPHHLGPSLRPKLKWTLKLFVILKALVEKTSAIGYWSVRKSAYRGGKVWPL